MYVCWYCFNLGQGRFRFFCVCVNRNVFILNMEITKNFFFFFNLTKEPNFLAQLCSLWARRGSPLHPFVACQITTLSVSHKYFLLGWAGFCAWFQICVLLLFAMCFYSGGGGSHLIWGLREPHPFGENGQEILPSYKEPGELLFCLFKSSCQLLRFPILAFSGRSSLD